MATRHQRIHPFERYQPWSVLGMCGFCSYGAHARLKRGDEGAGAVRHASGLPNGYDALKNLCNGARTEDQQLRRRLDAVEGALHVGSGGIADVTGVLGQHQIGCFLAQHICLDVKGAGAGSAQRTHLGLHLGTTEHSGVNEAAADYRFMPGCSRVVTEVTNPDELIAEAQVKYDLRP